MFQTVVESFLTRNFFASLASMMEAEVPESHNARIRIALGVPSFTCNFMVNTGVSLPRTLVFFALGAKEDNAY